MRPPMSRSSCIVMSTSRRSWGHPAQPLLLTLMGKFTPLSQVARSSFVTPFL